MVRTDVVRTDVGAARGAGEGVLHPAVVGALVVLIVNDHVLKARWPGAVTGKVSDVAGLVVFPILLTALVERAGRRNSPRPAVALTAVVLTAVAFAAVKLSPWGEQGYEVGLGALQWPFLALRALLAGAPLPGVAPVDLVRDPTDLWAMVALVVPLRLGLRRGRDEGLVRAGLEDEVAVAAEGERRLA